MYYFQEGSGSSAADASGYNRTCSINASVQWAPAKFGQGLRFNRANAGDSRSLTCGAAPALTAFTLDFWYNPDADGDGKIAGALAGGGNGGGGNNWALSNFEGRMRLDVWPCGSCGSSEVRSDFNLRDAQHLGKWHHIAVTFNGGNEVKFYLDGALNSAKTLGQSGINTFAPPLEIGSTEGGAQLKGNLGAFRISNIARTDFGYGAFAGITSEPSLALGAVVNPPVVGTIDLAVLDLNAYPYANGTQLIEAIVQNQGTLPTGNNFYTDLYLNRAPTGKGDLAGSTRFWVNESIQPGQVVTLTTVLDSVPTAAQASVGRVGAMTAAAESSGTLYVQTDSSASVSESNTGNNTLAQGVDVCVTSDDSYEGNNTRTSATLLAVGATQRHNFGSPADEDWLQLTLAGAQTYTLRTQDLDPAADTLLELYDAGGALLAVSDDVDGGLSSRITHRTSGAGAYYLRVRHWNPTAAGCGTSYSVQAQVDLPVSVGGVDIGAAFTAADQAGQTPQASFEAGRSVYLITTYANTTASAVTAVLTSSVTSQCGSYFETHETVALQPGASRRGVYFQQLQPPCIGLHEFVSEVQVGASTARRLHYFTVTSAQTRKVLLPLVMR